MHDTHTKCIEQQHIKNTAAVVLGRLGGKAGRGASKARKITSEQARKAALARWAKVKISDKTVEQNRL